MKKLVLLLSAIFFVHEVWADIADMSWIAYHISDKCPQDSPFFFAVYTSDGKIYEQRCASCFEEDRLQIEPGHEKDFEICTNRETILDEGRLFSVKKCPADKPLRQGTYGDCVACDSQKWLYIPAGRCRFCGDASIRKEWEKWLHVGEDKCRLCGDMRIIKESGINKYCVLNISPDPSRPLVDNIPHDDQTFLFSCDEPTDVITTKENCDLCPNREYVDGKCILKERK